MDVVGGLLSTISHCKAEDRVAVGGLWVEWMNHWGPSAQEGEREGLIGVWGVHWDGWIGDAGGRCGLVGGRRALGDKRPRKPTPRPASLRIDFSLGVGSWVA